MKAIAFAICLLLFAPGWVCAQEQKEAETSSVNVKDDTQKRLDVMEEKIRALEAEIATLKAQLEKRPSTETAAVSPAPAPQAPAPPGAAASSAAWRQSRTTAW